MKFTPRIPINFYRPAFCLWMVLVFAGFSPSFLMAQSGLAIDQQLIPVMTPADPGSPCTGNPIFPYYFGTSLAVSGPDLVVGSPFLFTNSGILDFASVFAYTFDSPNNQWQPTQVLCTDNLTDAFGWSVSVSEDLLVAGAPNTWGTLSFPSVGGIHTYRKNLSGDWDLVESLFGTASGDVYFGESVSVASGDGIGDHVLAVGTRDRPSSGGGGAQPPEAASQVWFYRHPATPSWTQWDLINAVSAPPGSSVITFGESVSVSKYTGGSECSGPTEIAIVGNPASNRAEVYLRFANSVSGPGSLFVHHQTISGPVGTTGFGNAVVVKEDTAVIGSQNGGGAVYRMDGYPSFLFQMEDQLIPAGGSGSPVTSVSLDGDIAALGVPGSVFLFYRNSQTGDWAFQLEADVMGDSIGHSVAIQSGTLFTGAADPLNQSVWDGTAYIFSPTSDCNGNGIPDEIDIGNGLSLDNDSDGIPDECGDCNANGFPDYADLASGFSQDCNNNNFPDECDLWADCNSNGINDLCDISSGLSTDCNGNNSPDECESLDDCNNNGTPDLCDIAPGGTSSDIDNNNVPDDCQGCHFPTATSWEETQQLLGTTASERFGATLAMSENLMVVGSPLDSTQFSEAGSTEVYRLVNGSWQLEQALQSPTPQADERFGNSVDVFDDGSGGGLVVISTRPVLYGASLVINVYVYRFDSSQSSPWVLEKVLTPATGAVTASPGSSVAVDRDYIAVGVPFGGPPLSGDLGRVYVYRFDDLISGQWTASPNGPLYSGVIDDRFGTWVDIQISETPGGETDFVVVGAPAAPCGNSGTDSGLAYIFKRYSTGGPGLPTDNLWSMESVVWPIDGQADSYKFGASVAISDDVIVVGAIQYPDGPGSAHIFRRDDSLNNWLPEQKLVASDGQPGDIFGRSVAISGNTVVVGAYGDTGSTFPTFPETGSAYVYRYEPSNPSGELWTYEKKLLPTSIQGGDRFGVIVAISGCKIAVGASKDDDVALDSGSAFLFDVPQCSDCAKLNTVELIPATTGTCVSNVSITMTNTSGCAIISAQVSIVYPFGPPGPFPVGYSGPTVSPSNINFPNLILPGDPIPLDVLISGAVGGDCVCLEIVFWADDGYEYVECCTKTVCVRTPAQAGCGDCNDDGVPDAIAILLGMSNDCNNDGIPDDCQGIPWPCDVKQMRIGDPNGDGVTNIADSIAMLGYLFSGEALNCVAAMDVNGDNLVDISDPIYELSYLFGSGAPPVGGGECTPDPDPADPPLECESSGCP